MVIPSSPCNLLFTATLQWLTHLLSVSLLLWLLSSHLHRQHYSYFQQLRQ
jgi:hypothetical protein